MRSFPVFFPDSREILLGEGFAPDCVIRQRVLSFRDSLALCLKNAHLAGIRHSRSTGELALVGFNASFGEFSLFALLAVDLS